MFLNGKNIYDLDVDVVDLRQRVGMVFQRPNPSCRAFTTTLPLALVSWDWQETRPGLDDIIRESLRRRRALDEVKHRLQDYAQSLNPRPATTSVHRPRHCRQARSHPHGRALLCARPCSNPARGRPDSANWPPTTPSSSSPTTCSKLPECSDSTGFFWLGKLIEFNSTDILFRTPKDPLTEAYITGRRG